jgi:uncharacterized protein with ParB-like and HNH nuclease domain
MIPQKQSKKDNYLPLLWENSQSSYMMGVYMEHQANDITVKVKSIGEILDNANLHIPDYQRPYKWERRHIRNLFYDVREAIAKNINEYRMGSIILHNNSDKLDIVDGQQRLISISLLLYYIKNEHTKDDLLIGAKKLLESENYIAISRKCAKDNYEEWKSLCNLISKEEIYKIAEYIQNNCKTFVITIPKDNLPQAFQLFDSQNNRGKSLEPHDLLKAYHLRAIKNPEESMIENWENCINPKNDKLKLKDLFDKHLFRIRRWVNGNTGLNKKKYGSELKFSERFIDDFKGVELDDNKNYPYLQLYKRLKTNNIEFPNSLTMPIINGEAFFNFIKYSYSLFEKEMETYKIERANKYLMSQKGKYSRNNNLYINLMTLFCDRFGVTEIDKEVCEKIFVWAYYPRVEAVRIYDSTIANYAGNGTFGKQSIYQKLFQVLATSATPREFIANINTDLLGNKTVDDIVNELAE